MEYDELEALMESGEAGDHAEARLASIDAEGNAFKTDAYHLLTMSHAGAFVALGYNGTVSVERG